MVRCDDRMRAALGGLESVPLTELQEAVSASTPASFSVP